MSNELCIDLLHICLTLGVKGISLLYSMVLASVFFSPVRFEAEADLMKKYGQQDSLLIRYTVPKTPFAVALSPTPCL